MYPQLDKHSPQKILLSSPLLSESFTLHLLHIAIQSSFNYLLKPHLFIQRQLKCQFLKLDNDVSFSQSAHLIEKTVSKRKFKDRPNSPRL